MESSECCSSPRTDSTWSSNRRLSTLCNETDHISTPSTSEQAHLEYERYNRTFEEFLAIDTDILSGPAPFNFQYFRDFVASTDARRLFVPYDIVHETSRCLFQRLTFEPVSGTSLRRQDAAAVPSLEVGRAGKHNDRQLAERKEVNPIQLLECLEHQEAEQSNHRTTIFLTDMTSEYVRVLATKSDAIYCAVLREYLSMHLSDETYFSAVVFCHHDMVANNKFPRHLWPKVQFVFEFHLPYVALRGDKTRTDLRGVRETISLIKPLMSNSKHGRQHGFVCHEAQISFCIMGTSKSNWIAFCKVDTYFGSEQDVNTYLCQGLDGPSGGMRSSAQPCLHPYEYFVLVLSQRLRQISTEWGAVFTHLTKILDTYETHYLRTIDSSTSDLHDDESMSRTRSYSKAASMLGQYHDTISAITERLDIFLKENNDLLFLDIEEYEDQCGCYRKHIEKELNHIKMWQKRLYTRMHRFNSMRDGLLNASNLQASRRAARQGYDIGVLTYVTVAYLPFSVAAGVLSISADVPERRTWIYWATISVVLSVITLILSFHPKLKAFLHRHLHRKQSLLGCVTEKAKHDTAG